MGSLALRPLSKAKVEKARIWRYRPIWLGETSATQRECLLRLPKRAQENPLRPSWVILILFLLFSLQILAIFCSFPSGNIRLEEFFRVALMMILAYTCTNPFYATRTTQKMSLWSRRTMETRYVALTMFILEFDLFLPCFCPKCS